MNKIIAAPPKLIIKKWTPVKINEYVGQVGDLPLTGAATLDFRR